MTTTKHHFRIIDECPVTAGIAPYIYVVTHSAHAPIDSAYRGTDARPLLNKYGKHDQEQLYEMYEHGEGNPANPPGRSTHELRSDGSAYPGYAVGAVLPWWCLGFDLADPDKADDVIHQAQIRGWEVFQPYPGSSEAHHLNFRRRPHPSTLRADGNAKRIKHLRATLPRS